MTLTKQLLLASESPRRREMISWLELPYQVTCVDIDEKPQTYELPSDLAVRLATTKARAASIETENTWILAADTIVDFKLNALGKPKNDKQADVMLRNLREMVHQVHTGLALVHPVTGSISIRRVTTDVRMRKYTDSEIAAYIASGDPMDKAGAYAIQHTYFHPVHRIDRCYANVVGLPLCALVEELTASGFTITRDTTDLCLLHFGYLCPRPDKGTRV